MKYILPFYVSQRVSRLLLHPLDPYYDDLSRRTDRSITKLILFICILVIAFGG